MKVRRTGYKQDRERYFTIGKIYEVSADGALTDDTNFEYTALVLGTNPNDWILSTYYVFEVVPESNGYELHITCNDGKTTNAVYKVNGKIEKRTEAVCAPSDTFDFATGAQTAFDRVFPKAVTTQPITPQEDKPKYKSGGKVRVLANTNSHCFKIGETVTLRGERLYNGATGKFYWSTGIDSGYVREQDIEPYAEPEQPKSKYESMSNTALKNSACNRGLCSACNSTRKADCPLNSVPSGYVCGNWLEAHPKFRATVIAYLENEDLPEEPKTTEPSLTVTREMLVKLGACTGGISTFDRLFPSSNGVLEDVCTKAEKDGHEDYSEWLSLRKDRIGEMQNEQPKETVKLYCVKDYEFGKWFTKGNTYEAIKNGVGERYSLTFDSGWRDTTFSLEKSTIEDKKIVENFFVPLVKRPAKVGEWVYVTHTDFSSVPLGSIYQVARRGCDAAYLTDENWCFFDSEYLVLDGYSPEPEKEPEPVYYNGKVVCVENGYKTYGSISGITVGKIYNAINGVLTNDDGYKTNRYSDIEDLCSGIGHKFIPYLGE